MSKVVHLSDEAHNKAKNFCKEQGLRMSDWVAALIENAIAGSAPQQAPVAGVVAVTKRKDLKRFEEPEAREVAAVYEAPPFWATRQRGAG